jgi:hypothetical protein
LIFSRYCSNSLSMRLLHSSCTACTDAGSCKTQNNSRNVNAAITQYEVGIGQAGLRADLGSFLEPEVVSVLDQQPTD